MALGLGLYTLIAGSIPAASTLPRQSIIYYNTGSEQERRTTGTGTGTGTMATSRGGKPWSGQYWRVRKAGDDNDYFDLWFEWGGKRRWIGLYSTRAEADRGKAGMRTRVEAAYRRSPLDGAEEITAICDRLGRWGTVKVSEYDIARRISGLTRR